MKLAVVMLWLVHAVPALAADAGTYRVKNPRIAAALELFKAGKLAQAESELRLTRAKGDNTSADLAQLSILEGMLSVISGENEPARAAFTRALALDPEAGLPDFATARIRKVFEEVRAQPRPGAGAAPTPPPTASTRGSASSPATTPAPASGPGLDAGAAPSRNLPVEFEQLYAEGKLDEAQALLNAASASKLSEVESGQLLVLKGLLVVLRSLQKDETPEVYRSQAEDLEGVEARIAEATANAQLTQLQAAQFLALRSSLLVVKGVLLAEAGDEVRAKASFQKALELHPGARLPEPASARARKLFARLSGATRAPRGAGRSP